MVLSRPLALLGAFSLVAVAACTDPAQVSGPRSKTEQGALLGGLFGAAVGAISSDDNKRSGAVKGAIVGAAAGALVGNYLDRQEAQLRSELGPDVAVRNTGDRLIVTMPQDILFDYDSDYVRPELRRDLRVVADSLLEFPNSRVQVVGHTDSTGDAAYNLELSQRRAAAVARILIGYGVPADRIEAIGRGESQPVADNLTPEGRARNRRVEIVILPTEA